MGVVEAVGATSSFGAATGVAGTGGTVGHVGVPVHPVDLGRVHMQNIRLLGGVAPVRAYMEDLLEDAPGVTRRWTSGGPSRCW